MYALVKEKKVVIWNKFRTLLLSESELFFFQMTWSSHRNYFWWRISRCMALSRQTFLTDTAAHIIILRFTQTLHTGDINMIGTHIKSVHSGTDLYSNVLFEKIPIPFITAWKYKWYIGKVGKRTENRQNTENIPKRQNRQNIKKQAKKTKQAKKAKWTKNSKKAKEKNSQGSQNIQKSQQGKKMQIRKKGTKNTKYRKTMKSVINTSIL